MVSKFAAWYSRLVGCISDGLRLMGWVDGLESGSVSPPSPQRAHPNICAFFNNLNVSVSQRCFAVPKFRKLQGPVLSGHSDGSFKRHLKTHLFRQY